MPSVLFQFPGLNRFSSLCSIMPQWTFTIIICPDCERLSSSLPYSATRLNLDTAHRFKSLSVKIFVAFNTIGSSQTGLRMNLSWIPLLKGLAAHDMIPVPTKFHAFLRIPHQPNAERIGGWGFCGSYADLKICRSWPILRIWWIDQTGCVEQYSCDLRSVRRWYLLTFVAWLKCTSSGGFHNDEGDGAPRDKITTCK